jgi:hypothetical protein
MVCNLSHFIKCICRPVYWIHENTRYVYHKIREFWGSCSGGAENSFRFGYGASSHVIISQRRHGLSIYNTQLQANLAEGRQGASFGSTNLIFTNDQRETV